ncbi:DsbA family protein [Myxococcota bacterium]
MTLRGFSSRILGALGLMSLTGASGCSRVQGTGEVASDPSMSRTRAPDLRTGEAREVPNSCARLTHRLCREVGRDSSICRNAEATFDLLSSQACRAGLQDFAATRLKVEQQREKCGELEARLCAGVGPDTESCAMVKKKTREFPVGLCLEMLDQVDEIAAELKQRELAKRPLDADQQAKIAAGDVPSLGPTNAQVTVVAFSDFECPYCSLAAGVTSQVRERFRDEVRLVFRQFPLSLHRHARDAAKAALAAHAQGKFWELHDKMFHNQNNLDRASLEGYAEELELDLAEFRGTLDSQQNEARVERDIALGTEVAVVGTPTLFINGQRIGNATDWAEVSEAIETALGG